MIPKDNGESEVGSSDPDANLSAHDSPSSTQTNVLSRFLTALKDNPALPIITLLLSTLIGAAHYIGKQELNMVRKEINVSLCEGISTALEFRNREIERALFEGVLDDLNTEHHIFQSLENTITLFSKYKDRCQNSDKIVSQLQILHDGLSHYAVGSYDLSLNDFQKLDKASPLFFYLCGASLYQTSYTKDDSSMRREASEYMMSAYKLAQRKMGSLLSRYAVLKLKCNAHSYIEENALMEECLKELLGGRQNGAIFLNLVISNLRSDDYEEAIKYFQKMIDTGWRVCRKDIEENDDFVPFIEKNEPPELIAMIKKLKC